MKCFFLKKIRNKILKGGERGWDCGSKLALRHPYQSRYRGITSPLALPLPSLTNTIRIYIYIPFPFLNLPIAEFAPPSTIEITRSPICMQVRSRSSSPLSSSHTHFCFFNNWSSLLQQVIAAWRLIINNKNKTRVAPINTTTTAGRWSK